MLNIYTSRQKHIGRNVVYNLYDFFDNTVVDAIAQSRYMLTDEDRVTLGKEGYITGVADGIISTKYGEMTLKNISLAAKAILSIRYLAAVDMCTVLNITDVLYDLEEVLKTAEQEHIGVLLYFKYYPMSWKNIEITACFNDDTVMPMKEYSESVTEFGEGYGREIYLSFGDDAAHIVSDSNEETLCCSDLQERYVGYLQKTLPNLLNLSDLWWFTRLSPVQVQG